MDTIKTINYIIGMIFLVCYSYQFFYILIPFLFRARHRKPASAHNYAVLISARNEEKVISQLISSIRKQNYDQSLITVFVVADNCTDATARTARAAGAVVYERFDAQRVGKGYALNYLLGRIDADYPDRPFDGYFVFDADNILDENYISEMNRVFSNGYNIVTSYRDSKNYGDNWISAGYALWFLRESQYLNNARMLLGTSCAVSGTGFMFSRKVLDDCGGWNFFLLTEDIEFTVHNVARGEKIGFARNAVLYDEQPTTFAQSWRQRKRWSRGYIQVFRKEGKNLLRGMAHGNFGCFDMFMNIMPAAVLSAIGISVNLAAIVISIARGDGLGTVAGSALALLLNTCLTVFIIGAITTVTEWNRIYAPAWKKIVYTFTFPLFMLTYIPIYLAALMDRNTGWLPIEHTRAATLEDIRAA